MPKVVKYEPAQYPSAVKNMKHITAVVLVFHPQCGHCIQLRPAWEQMKRQAPPQARFVEINGEQMSENSDLSQSDIGRKTEGFPSIMRVKNGHVVEQFNQERTVPNMVNFVRKSMQDIKQKTAHRKGKKVKKTRRNKH